MKQWTCCPSSTEIRTRNPKDSKAICFECFTDGKWHGIGYVVKEALDSVHSALNQSQTKQLWTLIGSSMLSTGPGQALGGRLA